MVLAVGELGCVDGGCGISADEDGFPYGQLPVAQVGQPSRDAPRRNEHHLLRMKRLLLSRHLSFIAAAVSLAVPVFWAHAQSPTVIQGRTIQLTIASGTSPFASSGVYRFLPSGVDSVYALVPISGSIAASIGTHTYSKTGADTARLSMVDSGAGGLTANCTFNTPSSGTYTLTSTASPGGSQAGTFVLYAGASPTSLAGITVIVTITSGEFPFATWGSYRFLPTASGTYNLIILSGTGQNSSGTYSYSQNSAYTGVVSFNDSIVGQGLTYQLSFDTPTTGTVFLHKSGSTGYQTGVFSMTTPAVPPSITTNPLSQTVSVGANVTFSVNVSGTAPLSYQWQRNGANLTGETNSTLTLRTVASSQAGSYAVVVSNAAGSVPSLPATLTVNPVGVAPSITTQPKGQTVSAGSSVTFSVSATGTAPLNYQWQKNGVNIVGATNSILALNAVTSDQAGNYTVIVSNAASSVPSQAAVLSVTARSSRFQSIRMLGDGSAELTLEVETGRSYSIDASTDLKNWSELGGFLSTDTVRKELDTSAKASVRRYYRLRGPSGPTAPTITRQPQSQDATAGDTVTFTVEATGTLPLSYQWRHNGVDLAGKTGAALTLARVVRGQAGNYTVVVRNSAGSVVSDIAALTVEPGGN